MKDLSSAKYWSKFGELGADIGRAWMPSPKEAAETVLTLMRERESWKVRAEVSERKHRMTIQRLEQFLLDTASNADAVRGIIREKPLAASPRGASAGGE